MNVSLKKLSRIVAMFCLLFVAGTLVSASATISTQNRNRYCRYQSVDNAKWSHHEVHLTEQCAIRHWSVSGGFTKAHYISERESGDGWFARNPSSGTCGIYQHQPSLWPGRVQAANKALPNWNLGPSCYNARSNIIVSIHMAHSGGWGPWGM